MCDLGCFLVVIEIPSKLCVLACSLVRIFQEQFEQIEAPCKLKVPALQFQHCDDKLNGLNMPGEHGVHTS